jgi:hypothetical protein
MNTIYIYLLWYYYDERHSNAHPGAPEELLALERAQAEMEQVKTVTIGSLSFDNMLLKQYWGDWSRCQCGYCSIGYWMAKWNTFFPNLREVVLELKEDLFPRAQQDDRLGKPAVVIDEVNEVVKRSEFFIRNLEREKAEEGIKSKGFKILLAPSPATSSSRGPPPVLHPNTMSCSSTIWPSLSIATEEKASAGGVKKALTYA